MLQASSRSWSASSTGVGADWPRCEGVGEGGLSVRISGLCRTFTATLAADVPPGVATFLRLPVMGVSGVAADVRPPPSAAVTPAGAVVRTWYRLDRNCSPQ